MHGPFPADGASSTPLSTQRAQVHILLGYHGEASMSGLDRQPGTPEVANGELLPA
jgi:hypothetical protein